MFVCLRNICRSPLAAAIFHSKVKRQHLEKIIYCESSGTANWHVGDPPDQRTIEVAEKHGIRMDHKGSQFCWQGGYFDYIMAMDEDNVKELVAGSGDPGQKKRIFLMRNFDNLKSGTGVPDPYYGNRSDFEEVYHLLDECCDNFLEFLVKEHALEK